MLFSTALLSVELNDFRNFSVACPLFDIHIQREAGAPFWDFAKRSDAGGLELWGLGCRAAFTRLSPGQYQVTRMA